MKHNRLNTVRNPPLCRVQPRSNRRRSYAVSADLEHNNGCIQFAASVSTESVWTNWRVRGAGLQVSLACSYGHSEWWKQRWP